MHTPDDIFWQIALTLIPGIGCVRAKTLLEHFGSARAVFDAPLEALEAIDRPRAAALKRFKNFRAVEQTLAFVRKHHISILCLADPDYPSPLRECFDPPTLLYYKGNVSLNHPRIVSVIGTRTPSPYGKQLTATLLKELAAYDVLVVSGLADGIDALAHRSALASGLSTIGVLGHGLDTLYPADNRLLAKEMLRQGGLLTEFPQSTPPAKQNFPRRNRIVAGLAGAVIIVETNMTRGSMITAGLALGYGRDIYTFPGRTTDAKSSGCNALIRQNKAALITCAADLAWMRNWRPATEKSPLLPVSGRSIPAAAALPDPDQETLRRLLQNAPAMHVDELQLQSRLSPTMLAAALLSLELQQIVESLPGQRYRLIL